MRAFDILFENNHCLAVRKEPGVLSQKNERGEVGLTELIASETGSPVFPVHRLDRETGGVMVFAKTARAASSLSDAIREGAFHKEYLAILTGRPPEAEGILEHLLYYDRKRGKAFPVKRARGGVRLARLRYRVLAEKDGAVLVRVFPETGRTHQIRVQFAAAGSPLLGDGRYGGGSGQLALFCRAIGFPDPQTGSPLHFSQDPEGGVWERFKEEIGALSADGTAGESLL